MTELDFSMPLKLIRTVRMKFREAHDRVKIQTALSDSFDYNTGLRQDDGLSACRLT